MLAQLVAATDGSSILLDKPILLLGRHPECDIQIDSRKVSRRHCCIALVADYLVVRDLGSTNGVRINGVRVTEGQLKPGDELTVGNFRYQLRLGPPEATERGAAIQAAAPPARPVVRPADAMEDDLLEACDEPVPLEEPASPAARAPEAPDRVVAPPSASIIVPDHLDLAPASDILPGPPPPQPPA